MKACKLCGSRKSAGVYQGPIRSGQPGETVEGYAVLECQNCGVQFLDPFPAAPIHQYTAGDYRAKYNQFSSASDHAREFHARHEAYLSKIGKEALQNKVVADIGCGGGTFLALAKNYTQEIIAVEPDPAYHPDLKKLGSEVFATSAELRSRCERCVDIAVCFTVIEHVESPKSFLEDIAYSLRRGGKLILTTPNREEILMRSHAKIFAPFFFRTAHVWYFSADSLSRLVESLGLTISHISTYHEQSLGNYLTWLRDCLPKGTSQTFPQLSDDIDSLWKDVLGGSGLGQYVWLEARLKDS